VPESKGLPDVPGAINSKESASVYATDPAEAVIFLFVPPFAKARTPETSDERSTFDVERTPDDALTMPVSVK
jgi:hypothetical protein